MRLVPHSAFATANPFAILWDRGGGVDDRAGNFNIPFWVWPLGARLRLMTKPLTLTATRPLSLKSRPSAALSGVCRPPGDKSLSHRALILGAQAIGETTIFGLLEGEDVLHTAAALMACGVAITQETESGKAVYRVSGVGTGGLAEPAQVLDCGNSGTGARLLMGLVAGHAMTATFTGDASLSRRPMGRIIEPLSRMGAQFVAREGGLLPITVTGPEIALPIAYRLPVASAQVKSAILLAGMNARGETSVSEPQPSRDHTERMLRHFGVAISTETEADGTRTHRLRGQQDYRGTRLDLPADPSSAAFPLVAALIIEGSDIVLQDVGLNPLRTGLFTTLLEMGADIAFSNERVSAGEPVGDIRVRASRLTGVEVPAARAPSMIDEYPILAVAATFAKGETVMRGLGELRMKESDRLATVAAGLTACGIEARISGDDLIVAGQDSRPRGGHILTAQDHRIAMGFLVLGLASREGVTIDDGNAIATSFPSFVPLMQGLGAPMERQER